MTPEGIEALAVWCAEQVPESVSNGYPDDAEQYRRCATALRTLSAERTRLENRVEKRDAKIARLEFKLERPRCCICGKHMPGTTIVDSDGSNERHESCEIERENVAVRAATLTAERDELKRENRVARIDVNLGLDANRELRTERDSLKAEVERLEIELRAANDENRNWTLINSLHKPEDRSTATSRLLQRKHEEERGAYCRNIQNQRDALAQRVAELEKEQ